MKLSSVDFPEARKLISLKLELEFCANVVKRIRNRFVEKSVLV